MSVGSRASSFNSGRSDSDRASTSSGNMDALSVSFMEEMAEALRQSVMTVLENPEQLATLSDEDQERIRQLAGEFFGAELRAAAAETAGVDDSRGTAAAGARVTQEENLAQSMRMIHEEMGTRIFALMPTCALFDIIKSVAQAAASKESAESQQDEERAAVMELLSCSSARNIIQRLEAWPACSQKLTECVAASEFKPLFDDAWQEFSGRFENEERQSGETGEYRMGMCDLCCSVTDTLLWHRGCCQTSMCVSCLHHWLTDRVSDVQAKLSCPGCAAVLTVAEIRHLLSEDAVSRRERLLSRDRDGKSERDCPRCSSLTRRPVLGQKRGRFGKSKKTEKDQGGLLVKCEQCDFLWCFDCHSPLHPGLSCRQHRTGAQQLESWARNVAQEGLRTAQRCPKCRVLIEKNEGCNHMTCAHCQHEFCYICKKRWHVREIHVPYLGWSVFGSHSSRLSVFGCSQSFQPDRPALRRLARGCLFVLRACGLVVVPTVAVAILLPLALALVAVAIPLSPIIIPIVLVCVCRKKRRAS